VFGDRGGGNFKGPKFSRCNRGEKNETSKRDVTISLSSLNQPARGSWVSREGKGPVKTESVRRCEKPEMVGVSREPATKGGGGAL